MINKETREFASEVAKIITDEFRRTSDRGLLLTDYYSEWNGLMLACTMLDKGEADPLIDLIYKACTSMADLQLLEEIYLGSIPPRYMYKISAARDHSMILEKEIKRVNVDFISSLYSLIFERWGKVFTGEFRGKANHGWEDRVKEIAKEVKERAH